MKPPSAIPPVPPSPPNAPTASLPPSGTTPASGGAAPQPAPAAARMWLLPVGVAGVCVVLWLGSWASRHAAQPPSVGPFPSSSTATIAPGSAALPSQPAQPNVPAAGTGSPPAATGQEIVVQVTGRVVSPGLYRLPVGSRVNDAVQQAGGVLSDGNADALNLAARVGDGDRIVVPSRNAAIAPGQGVSPLSGPGDSNTATPSLESLRNNPINLNTATEAQLDALPGIGPTTAQRIVAYRVDKGQFHQIDDLANVGGIGQGTINEIRPFVTVQ